MSIKINKYYIYISLLVLAGISFVALKKQNFQSINDGIQIKFFDDKRDRNFIKKAIDDDYYWLVNYPNFEADFMLDNMVPAKDKMEFLGRLNVRTLTENNKPIGFITFYPINFSTARIQFLCIDKECRGKGYAKKLMDDTISEIKDMGYENVVLVTRTTNKPAIELYKRLGFNIVDEDSYGILYFKKSL